MTTPIACCALCIFVLLICCQPVNAREELQNYAAQKVQNNAALYNTPHEANSTNYKKQSDAFPHTNASTPINSVNTLHGFSVITVSEAEIMATWDDGGLDALCQKALPYFAPDVRAARLFSKQDNRLLESEIDHHKITGRLYLGARLYPSLSHGWYWAGRNWTSNGAIMFFSHYSNDNVVSHHTNKYDDHYNHNNWAEFGTPSLNDPYGSKQAVIYNTTLHGWQAVSLQKTGNAQVACAFDKTNNMVTLYDRLAEQYNSHRDLRSNQALLEEDENYTINKVFKVLTIIFIVFLVISWLFIIPVLVCQCCCVEKNRDRDCAHYCCCCCFWSRRNNQHQDEESSSSSDEESITPSHEPANEFNEPVMK